MRRSIKFFLCLAMIMTSQVQAAHPQGQKRLPAQAEEIKASALQQLAKTIEAQGITFLDRDKKIISSDAIQANEIFYAVSPNETLAYAYKASSEGTVFKVSISAYDKTNWKSVGHPTQFRIDTTQDPNTEWERASQQLKIWTQSNNTNRQPSSSRKTSLFALSLIGIAVVLGIVTKSPAFGSVILFVLAAVMIKTVFEATSTVFDVISGG